MSHSLAEDLLALVGPGRILHYGCSSTSLVSALLQRGCDAWGWIVDPVSPTPTLGGRMTPAAHPDSPSSFDVVVVDGRLAVGAANLRALLNSLRVCIERTLVLDFSEAGSVKPMLETPDRLCNRQIEESVLVAGYRRHPAAFSVARYKRLNDPTPEPLLCFEKVPDVVLERWPTGLLLTNRNQYSDMSREASPRSDAHLVRYALAAEWIRSGDSVLDCACGLGYGTALLAAASQGCRFIGVDIDHELIAYAQDNFAGYPIEYHAVSALQLHFLPARSVDMVVTFETIEHLSEYERFFNEIARVLKPDGRVIGSVPNLWVHETGRDPNPHHFHAFDYTRIRDAFARHFIIEARYGQTAPGGVKLLDAPRQIDQRPLLTNAIEADTEWWIVVAAADPNRPDSTVYSHPEFDSCTVGTPAILTTFAEHYDNPWIYRQLIQNGQRIRDPDVLTATVDAGVVSADRTSADFGGMLAVKAYQTLQNHDRGGRTELMASIETYLTVRSDNPHVYRWQISLSYVAALLALSDGQRERGKAFLETVISLDPHRFSPLIATKTVAAQFLLGTMFLVDGQAERAQASFAAGVDTARRALHAPDVNAIGHPDHPLAFGFFELAEIADMAGQRSIAIAMMDKSRYSPGQFWRCVDAKRFGLFTWIHNLEVEYKREQARHLAEVDKLRSECSLRIMLPKRIKEALTIILPSLAGRTWERFLTVASLSGKPRNHK
jgi:SAM-dependent methyltransferase